MAAVSQFLLYQKVTALVASESKLVQQTMQLFPGWALNRSVTDDVHAFTELEKAIAHHLSTYRLAEVWAIRDGLHKALEGKSGRVVDEMRRFLVDVLGSPDVDEAAMLEAWSAHVAELSRVHGLAASLATVRGVAAHRRVRRCSVRRQRQPIQGGADQLSPRAGRAWRLRRLATHLAAIDSQDEFKKLAKVRIDLEHDLARAYHALVVRRTWRTLAEKATPSVRAGLQAYLNAIQKTGKGTGKRAIRYRQDARAAAAEAIPAVPCWIMPHYRVSESLPPELGCFDLVVIDEASQSDLSALPTLLRARKLLIVGDDQQVSPEGVGLEEQKIKTLMQRFLAEQVPLYRAQMSPERSIYDLAKVVFARSGVVLKEHFRRVAPIIEYLSGVLCPRAAAAQAAQTLERLIRHWSTC
jgi:hypothetical protein